VAKNGTKFAVCVDMVLFY